MSALRLLFNAVPEKKRYTSRICITYVRFYFAFVTISSHSPLRDIPLVQAVRVKSRQYLATGWRAGNTREEKSGLANQKSGFGHRKIRENSDFGCAVF